MTDFIRFMPISKIDEAKRTVYGVLSAEVVDKSGEIMDYATGKPEFQEWSGEAEKRSGGKSKGNIRAMHGDVAAGKLIALEFDDANKVVSGAAKIVDDDEWKKVLEGVYTGFSIGGKYKKRWRDPNNSELYRFTPELSEISIVDNPCVPTATFELIRSNGAHEIRKFKSIKESSMTKEELRKLAAENIEQGWLTKDQTFFPKKADAEAHEIEVMEKRDFTDKKRQELADKGHALPDGSFPIESESDLKNAVRAIGRAKDPEKAKAHIITRAKALGATKELPTDWEGSTKDKEAEKAEIAADVAKNMDRVASIACAIEHLNNIASMLHFEEAMENDDSSDAPSHMEEIVKELCELLTTYVAEETHEMVSAQHLEEMAMTLAAGLPKDKADAVIKLLKDEEKNKKLIESLGKAGARHSKTDKEHGAKLGKALDGIKSKMDEHEAHMGKMHKIAGHVNEAHADIAESHKDGDLSAAGSHLGKAESHMKKLHKAFDGMKDTHEEMQECYKDAVEHHAALGLGAEGEEEESPDDVTKVVDKTADKELRKSIDATTEAIEELKELTKTALTKGSEDKKEILEKLSDQDRLITNALDRVKKLEAQPAPAKGAVFRVTKGHGSEESDKSIVEPRYSNTNGMSPADIRKMHETR